MTNWITRYRM